MPGPFMRYVRDDMRSGRRPTVRGGDCLARDVPVAINGGVLTLSSKGWPAGERVTRRTKKKTEKNCERLRSIAFGGNCL